MVGDGGGLVGEGRSAIGLRNPHPEASKVAGSQRGCSAIMIT